MLSLEECLDQYEVKPMQPMHSANFDDVDTLDIDSCIFEEDYIVTDGVCNMILNHDLCEVYIR